jgi:hypothetical protein
MKNLNNFAMKKYKILSLVVLIATCFVTMGYAQDKKISELTAATTVSTNDLLLLSTPSGTNYTSKKITIFDFLNSATNASGGNFLFDDVAFATNTFIGITNALGYQPATNGSSFDLTANHLFTGSNNFGGATVFSNATFYGLVTVDAISTAIFTNTSGFSYADTNWIATNAHVFSSPILSSSSSVSSPAASEFATASWVRGLLNGGQLLYNITNIHPEHISWYSAVSTTNANQQARTYNNVTNGQYLGFGIMSTQRFTTVYSPMVVNVYLSYDSGASPARSVTLHPEFYYSYDGTNLLGDYETGNQTLIAGTNLYSFVLSFPTIQSTSSAGFYVARRIKIGTQNNNPDITIHGSGATASHISFQNPAVSDPSLGTRGATNVIVTLAPAITNVTYNTTDRQLTFSGPAVANLNANNVFTGSSNYIGSLTGGSIAFTNLSNTGIGTNIFGYSTFTNAVSITSNLTLIGSVSISGVGTNTFGYSLFTNAVAISSNLTVGGFAVAVVDNNIPTPDASGTNYIINTALGLYANPLYATNTVAITNILGTSARNMMVSANGADRTILWPTNWVSFTNGWPVAIALANTNYSTTLYSTNFACISGRVGGTNKFFAIGVGR